MKITKKGLKAVFKAQNVFVGKVLKNQSAFDKAFEDVEDVIIDCTEIVVQLPENQTV
ncbi:MAG: hypothetical protein RMJ87_07350 [Cytophagales bacterium]|nr:hypothetical protein [Bernardetiaceae bacterium]MDW8204828.1 hypothetical protein [Cytophagales bacterium]